MSANMTEPPHPNRRLQSTLQRFSSRFPKPHRELHEAQSLVADEITLTLPVGYGGEDSRGTKFSSVSAIWRCKAPVRAAHSWYQMGADYWRESSPDLDGVLGGQTHVDAIDLSESLVFLRDSVIAGLGVGTRRCLDCGAGIGRVTKGLLSLVFDRCDLVEQDEGLLSKAVIELSSTPATLSKLGSAVVAGLQELSFAELLAMPISSSSSSSNKSPVSSIQTKYDVVWFQWVVGCILDVDYIRLLKDASAHLSPNGCIVVKDNCCRDDAAFVYDCIDASIARSPAYHDAVFKMAGLRVVASALQTSWDSGLMQVRMWCLRKIE
jgi:protein N-terminal methyltransferase